MSLMMSHSCAEMHAYKSDISGPQAHIIFISPFLEDRFLSLDRLALFVLEPDQACQFIPKGNISLSDHKNMTSIPIPADRRVYFRLWQSNHEFMGSRGNAQRTFSFVPEEGKEYIVEHIDNQASLRAKFYQFGPNKTRLPMEVQGTESCRITGT